MSQYSTFTDQELTALLKDGEAAAFSELFRRYNRLLFAHAYRLLGDEEEARDLVQDLFTWVWDKHIDLNIATNFSGFLYTSIRNKVFDKIAHQKVEGKYLASIVSYLEKGEAKTDYLLREKELESIIEKEISNLPAHLKAVFQLSRKETLSVGEIADQLGLSEKTVRNNISLALKILRERLGLFIYLYFLLR